MSALFDWRPMDFAPRDGSKFACLTTCMMCSRDPMPFVYSADVAVMHRERWSGDMSTPGYWVTDLGNSRADHHVSHGHWMPLDEFTKIPIVLLYMERAWRSAPRDRVVAFLRVKLRDGWRTNDPWLDVGVDLGWYDATQPPDHEWRTSKVFGNRMAAGYMDGLNVAMGGYSWCEIDEFLPPDVIERERESRSRHDAFLAKEATRCRDAR